MSAKHAALYARVSSRKQDHKSQLPDLRAWADAHEGPVRWYRDKLSGKTLDRPGWRTLEAGLQAGKVSTIVVWRLDRLGRTASGLTDLFERLQKARVGLVSIKDSLDLSTAAGRLMANVLASMAVYENEVRSERILAGQAVARENGKTWGGSKPGRRVKVTDEQVRMVQQLRAEKVPITRIAKATGLSRPTIYSILAVGNNGGPP
jgi:DNA invertase Pin-like site-specific DNA recombinase